MTVRELSPGQYKELCQDYISRFWEDSADGTDAPSWGELACADELVDRNVIENYYDGITFTNDDFACTAGK
jgi:hypothetical protein